MKKIILSIFCIFLSVVGYCQGITAANGTVYVRGGSISVSAGTFTGSITGGSVSVTNTVTTTPQLTALALTSTSATASQTVAAGAKAVTIETSSDFVGNIDGISATASSIYPFSGGANGTLPQITITITSGSIRIRKLQ